MGRLWYSIAVVVLWLATMTWLVVDKVLPPLLVGDPPSYESIVNSEVPQPPVGWRLFMDGQRLGWSLSTITHQPNQAGEIHSIMCFERVPVRQFLPGWLRAMVPGSDQSIGHLQMEAESTMTIDPLGRLAYFDSALRVKPGLTSVVRLRGTIEGNLLKLSVHSGDLVYDPEISLPPEAMLGDSLAPQTRLPGLRAGQSWTVSSYSPMNILSNPIEILHAKVEGMTPLDWDGRSEQVWLVVYRTESSRANGDNNVRNRLWVRRDGTILRQQVIVGGSVLMFNRMSDEETALLPEAKKLHGGAL